MKSDIGMTLLALTSKNDSKTYNRPVQTFNGHVTVPCIYHIIKIDLSECKSLINVINIGRLGCSKL